ncbi:Mur ligase family protein [Cysteiniphilum halobium]|uniref:Mur ligase family protein n=1 Tax=Cysteiniphilum halobium TaxID=2219059 RepID=UPI003F86E4E5
MHEIPEGYSRRLVGPNLFFNETGVVLDIPLKMHQQVLIKLWQKNCDRLLPLLGFSEYKLAHKAYSEGLRLACTAPCDILLASCDVIDYTWQAACYEFLHQKILALDKTQKIRLLQTIKQEQNLAYRILYANAKAHGLNIFREKDHAYVGSGIGRYKLSLLTDDYLSLPWQDIYDIPQVIVTGTNGKTTTVRLTNFICQHAGKISGYASTDWVAINGEIIDRGDYSGPTGHQFVLTNPDVEVAVLESARGGLLKRGLIETQVSAATVTNVSYDHMGEDGVETLNDLFDAKCIVYRALAKDSSFAIINMDDGLLQQLVTQLSTPKILVSQAKISSKVLNQLTINDHACYVADNCFIWWQKGKTRPLVKLSDVPLTMNGHAKHNIENTLHAIALAFALGISFDKIVTALCTYQNTARENQGRANIYILKSGAIVIVDFAHNPAGFEAILSLAQAYQTKAGRLFLLFGTTGDRVNLIEASSKVIAQYKPDKILVKELKKYLRGATEGEIPKQIAASLIRFGLEKDTISLVDDELSGAKLLLSQLKQGDVCVLCCHDRITDVGALVKTYCK